MGCVSICANHARVIRTHSKLYWTAFPLHSKSVAAASVEAVEFFQIVFSIVRRLHKMKVAKIIRPRINIKVKFLLIFCTNEY